MKILLAIPTYKRPQLLKNLLTHLKKITIPDNCELTVYVIDNGNLRLNKDILNEIILPFAKEYVFESQRGVVHVRNKAIEKAKNFDFLCFLDDDDYPEQNWLVELLNEYDSSESDIILGMRNFFLCNKHEKWYKDFVYTKCGKFSEPKIRCRYGLKLHKGGTGNILIDSKILKDGLQFDPKFNFIGSEDHDFFICAEKRGYKISYAKNSIVNCLIRSEETSKSGYFKRARQYGNSLSYLLKKHCSIKFLFKYILMVFLNIVILTLALPFILFLPSRKKYKYLFKYHKYVGSLLALMNINNNLYKR